MSDNVPITPGSGATIATDNVGARHFQLVKLAYGADGSAVLVASESGLPVSLTGSAAVTGPLTNGELRAAPVPVMGTVTGPLTNAELRASAVTVTGTVSVASFPASQVVTGPVTDAQLRATPVAVSGPLTDAQLRASAVQVAGTVGVTGALTDAQLRASAVSVTVGNFPASQVVTGPLTDGELRAAAVPVVMAGAATEATLTALNVKTPPLATRPVDNEAPGIPTRQIGQEVWNCSFSDVGVSIIAPQFTTPIVGPGVGFSQAGGGLIVTSGTTANAGFLTRSAVSWRGAMRLRYSAVLSQRIVNNNFAVLLADLIGEGLPFTINSATSITVTLAAHGFTALNIGQFMLVGGIVGAAGVPGRYAIGAVPTPDTITFTVAGWPASGTGTLTLFGHSYVRNLYTGATATVVNVDAQRNGWASGDTAATINTTAAPGHILQAELTGRDVFWSDTLRASTGTPAFASRASRYENIPDDNLPLYVWLWAFNGAAAPASTTTWTLSYCAVEKFANTPVYVQGVRANGSINPLPVAGAVTVAGTVTANIGTGALAAGANLIGDVGLQVRANATGAATIHHVVSAATTNVAQIKATAGRVVGWSLANNAASWRYVKLHNIAAATAGAGVVMTIGIPPNSTSQGTLPVGVGFAAAISRSIVAGAADADATAIGAAEVVGDIFFA